MHCWDQCFFLNFGCIILLCLSDDSISGLVIDFCIFSFPQIIPLLPVVVMSIVKVILSNVNLLVHAHKYINILNYLFSLHYIIFAVVIFNKY